MNKNQVMKLLRAHIKDAGSQRQFCLQHGISTGQLNDVLTGRRPIPPKVLRAIGIAKRENYTLLHPDGVE